MSEDFYNTINLDGDELNRCRDKARSQQEIILAYFRAHPETGLTPDEIHRRLFGGATPLTSVRRAVTNLARAGRLWKSRQQRRGRYGKPNYVWFYLPQHGRLDLF